VATTAGSGTDTGNLVTETQLIEATADAEGSHSIAKTEVRHLLKTSDLKLVDNIKGRIRNQKL